MIITRQLVKEKLDAVLQEAEVSGRLEAVINSGQLHRQLGGYPGPDARMPIVCGVMYKAMVRSEDVVLTSPPSGLGASVNISYTLPRP